MANKDITPITRALLSVSDKTDLLELANFLTTQGVELVASGGTEQFLKKAKIKTTSLESVTHFPEILNGRVKTLHPSIHAGLLADHNNPNHLAELQQHAIQPFQLLVVNLYPFQQTLAEKNSNQQELIETIDIGGVALLRAAAKNFTSILVLPEPKDYAEFLAEWQKTSGQFSLSYRKKQAAKTFTLTQNYDTAIAGWLLGKENMPTSNQINNNQNEPTSIPFDLSKLLNNNDLAVEQKIENLRYGENPHQTAFFYKQNNLGLGGAKQWQGKALSYNNYLDCDAALRCLAYLTEPAVVIIKHNDACGVALGENSLEAFQKAFASDPISAFGGIIGFNRPLDTTLAQAILATNVFFEIVITPSIEPEAVTILSCRPNLRIVTIPDMANINQPRMECRSIFGGLLVQSNDSQMVRRNNCEIVTSRQPTEAEWQNLLFGNHVVQALRSNAVVVVGHLTSLGIGAGTTSRIAAAKTAVSSYINKKTSVSAVVASDGFFPFADSIKIFIDAGIKAIIQPGGSLKDKEVIATAEAAGLSMVLTHERHFRH